MKEEVVESVSDSSSSDQNSSDPSSVQAKGILQDLIVVASLVHTLTDSFGSASDLYRKLKKERKKSKDDNSDNEHRHNPLSRRKRRDSDSDTDSHDYRRFGRSRSKKDERSKSRRRDSHDSDEDSINGASELVLAEYRRGHHYLGEKFAKGDLIARNQLQSQIISLQSALLTIYQDAQHNPVSTHITHLLQTTRSARAAAIEALAMQYQRMLEIPETFPLLDLPGAFPVPVHGIPDLTTRPKLRRAKSIVSGSHSSSSASHSLYCAYARDLQKFPDQPLADAYRADGDGRCPYCRFISTRPGKAWEIVKEDEKDRDSERVFLVQQRFIVKCHREGGGFACVICSRCRERDTVTQTARDLVDHSWKELTCKELGEDEDIVEIG